ncbi:hypothetical protein LTR53_002247 [Teratosphaeriaceae sp. CCFEE 6253]|nr:hypothetical protein LTR53_002247 [Teratosphaeriaceae sp. CCFEE 6253]
MAAREKGGRVVFIGNIPYGVSEEQICDIFARVGSVVNFRLVYDKETSRPKGFGFLEYTDVDAAASAVRNLNDFEIMGRSLRVDYSNDNGGGGGGKKGGADDGGGGSGRAPPPAHFNMDRVPDAQPARVDPGALPPLPAGMPLQDGLTAPDAISKTLAAVPPAQLLDIISQMKNLSTVNPAQATALLAQAPQLGYAIFQALLTLGLVDSSVLGSLLAGGQPAQAPAPAVQPPPPTMQYQQPPPQQQQPTYAQPPPPQQYNQQPPQPYYAPQQYAPTPPAPHPAYQPPPPPQQQPSAPQQPPSAGPNPAQIAQILATLPPEQQAVMQQILEMPRETIFALEAGAREQILAVRRGLGVPVY